MLNICRQEKDAGGEKGETEKRARCRSDEDASQSSEHDLSSDPDSNEDDTEVEASDNGMLRCRIPGTRGTNTGRRKMSPSTFPATS